VTALDAPTQPRVARWGPARGRVPGDRRDLPEGDAEVVDLVVGHDAVGVGEGGLDGVILAWRKQAQVEGQPETGIDRDR